MYDRRERPLTDAEREQLTDRVRQTSEDVSGDKLKVVLLTIFDGFVFLACVMVALGKDRSGTAGVIAGGLAAVVANLVLVGSVFSLRHGLREKRQLRTALEDGVAVVEQVEATASAGLIGERRAWHVVAVGAGRLLALPYRDVPPVLAHAGSPLSGPQMPACFEVVTTRGNRLHLSTTLRGASSLPFPRPSDLAVLFPDPDARRRLADLLDAGPLFAGRLETLPVDLSRLLVMLPDIGERDRGLSARPESVGPAAWARLQARIEERFGIAFGPGGISAELARLAESRRGALTAGDLMEVVWRRLPPGAADLTRPLRPVFFRLREALVVECGAPRAAVRPSARLDDLVPKTKRADRWAALEDRLGQPLPPFAEADPPAVVWVTGLVGMGILYAVGVPTVQQIDAFAVARGFERAWWFRALGMLLVPTTFIGGIALAFLIPMYLFRNRFVLKFRAECATVRDLTHFLVRAGTILEVTIPWTEETTWLAVRCALAECAGKRPFEVTTGTRLVEDLGLSPPANSAS